MEWRVNGTNNGLSRRLTRLRNEAGLTRQELADRAGVTFNTINDIERGRRKRPMEKTLQTLASVLGVTYEYLVFGRGDASPSVPAPVSGWRLLRTGAYVGAGVLVVVVAFFHVRWERTILPSAYQCVIDKPYESVSDVRFDDVDGCGMVEAIYSSSSRGSWNVSRFDRTRDEHWQLSTVLTASESEGKRSNLFVQDVDGDGWKDIIALQHSNDEEKLLVLEGHHGDLLSILCQPSSRSICPSDEWESEKRVEAITEDGDFGSKIVLVSTAARSTSVSGTLCAIDIGTGTHVWQYVSEAVLRNVEVADVDGDGRSETLVWGQTTRPRVDGTSVTSATISALDSEGRVLWKREAGRGTVDMTGCLLDNGIGEAMALVAVNNRKSIGFNASYMLLFDARSGARIDSLSYTQPVINGLLAHWSATDGSWQVFCGTEHGSVRKYGIRDGHVRLDAERWIDHDWVWVWGFVGDVGPEAGIVIATADDVSFIVDADLKVLLRRPAEDGATISPLASFTDPAGIPYVAFLVHGTDLCIDRIVANRVWGGRFLYALGYALPLLALFVFRRSVT